MKVVVAGIGTEVGKTVVSAVLCEALEADYWKPVQAGELDVGGDCAFVRKLVSNQLVCHPEVFALTEPMSPHAAARIDGVEISLEDFVTPDSPRLVVELAGGLMVPLNHQDLNIDLIQHLGFPTVLVASYYLGSINHTLLSLELLRQRKVDLLGVIFNGEPNEETRNVILEYSGAELLAEIPHSEVIDLDFIGSHAAKIRQHRRLA